MPRVWFQGLAFCKHALGVIFPNSKIIVLVRNPLEAIPSRMSLTLALWGFRKPKVERLSKAHVQWILQNSIETYLKTEEGLKHIPDDRKIIIGYNDLKTKTRQNLHKITDHLALPALSSSVEQRLDEMERKSYLSKHQYDLSDYGLTPADIEVPLASVFQRYHHMF